MLLVRIRAVALLVAAAAAVGHGYQAGGQWPPPLQTVAEESPVLAPAASMKTIFTPPGYRLELVASEPMIQDPILIDFDPDGRLWAIEMPGYMPDLPATTEYDPTGRVVVLEDVDDDGKMDKRTIFLDGLVLPRALKVLDRGVLVAEPPNLWLARDTNGDVRADTKELVTDTYGQRNAGPEHNANGLMWGLDNWLHTSEHDSYLRLKNGRFEVQKTLSRGQWGLSMDDGGRIYRNTNEAALFVDLIPARYFMRHPGLLRTRGAYESLNSEGVNTVWPVRPTRGVNRGYQEGVLRPDGRLARFTSVSAPTVYRGDRLPPDLSGNVFVVEPAANLVSRLIVSDDGTGLKARKAYEGAEFLASTDERFRPVYLSSAPDGTLYVVDMYRGVIQHRIYVTEYLRDHILGHKLVEPTGSGRIYRVVHESTRRGRKPTLASASSSELVDVLAHPNGWWRDTAQRLLVERGDPSVVPALRQRIARAPDERTRLHALWTLDGLDSLDPALVAQALQDRSRDVRVSAIQLSERWLADAGGPLQAAVLKMTDDPDWAVRRQLAASFGELPEGLRERTLVTLLEKYGDDPVTVDAALSGLRGREIGVIESLMQGTTGTPQRDAAVTMLAATIVRGAQDAAVQSLFHWAAQVDRPEWQRSAILRGAEVSLMGAPMPGMPPPRPAAAAAPRASGTSAPGSRSGPGGAPAFPTASASGAGQGAARGRGGRGGAPALKLQKEPAIVSLDARDGDDIRQRVAALLTRIEWPGKDGVAAPAAPLTPAEQQRFAAGKQIYENICQACHQANGRGLDKLAPSLIGSPLALGPAAVTVRILLHGKEGPAGLMPPLGAAFDDEQVAAVLTYIRREWDQTGSPIDAAAVKEIRAQTAGRTRPWTAEELARIGGQ
jgi:mono/diheme cytochrome c family protein/glucose/arabinose dehydrogenase/HEAT repeat protein